MTFIDITGGNPSPGLIAGYSILAVVSLSCTAWAIHLGRTRLHYHSSFSVRVLFPVALAILTLENIALAMSGLIYEKLENDGVDNNYDSYLFMKAIFILQPFEVPLLLVVVFELTYLVHKSRSVNFCGMYFDEGRRVHNTAIMSCMLRNSIRSLATLLLVMGLLVNLDVIQDDVTIDALVGRAGWHSFFTMEGNAKAKMHLLLSLLPVAVLVIVCFYLSIMLWRYGTQSSMVVHSSMCNPWFYPFFGTVAMGVGQVFGPELYPVMSNAGILLFIITLLALMAEVDKDMVATHNVAGFLMQVAKVGDSISVTARPRAVQSVRQAYIEGPNNVSTFLPFGRQSFREGDNSNETVDNGRQPSSNANKSAHSISTDVTEPTSNVKKATGVIEDKSIANAHNSSLSMDIVEEDKAHSSAETADECDRPLVPNTNASSTNNENEQTPSTTSNNTTNNSGEIDEKLDEVESNKEKKPAEEEKEVPTTSTSIMKGLIDDVDVLIDEEIGERGILNDASENIDSASKEDSIE